MKKILLTLIIITALAGCNKAVDETTPGTDLFEGTSPESVDSITTSPIN